jgi:hypothetical protein
VLREINRRLATSEINDGSLKHSIFFGHDTHVFGALQRARSELVYRTTRSGGPSGPGIST